MINVNEEFKKLIRNILSCKKCRLYQNRRNAVPGEGPLDVEMMFIGEAPGAKEDEEGRPFVGAAGRLLTELLKSNGLDRNRIYITNVVKCRPPNNREPYNDEIEACLPYLLKQISLIKPKIIVALGRISAKTVFSLAGVMFKSMNKDHGIPRDVVIKGLNIKLIATYHPAAALYNPRLRGALEDDFKLIVSIIKKKDQEKTITLLDFLNEEYRVEEHERNLYTQKTN